ncbi:MAG: hypothetical protein D3903_12605 [Candidatus Electrothrix sp. GM3_4]|nr:hypothetical protein [Candidatus Electrothrix sp. GM3_4]
MASPTFVKLNRIQANIAKSVAQLENAVFMKRGIKLTNFAYLKESCDKYDGGLELVGDPVESDSAREAVTLVQGGKCFALSFMAYCVPGEIDLYFFDIEKDNFSVTLDFNASFLDYEGENLGAGIWLKDLLTDISIALQCEVCCFGADDAYNICHESINTDYLLSRLRSGEIFTIGYPHYHAISVNIVSSSEMINLLSRYERSEFLNYDLSTAGYHQLWIIP